jgi:hypothetical protein
LTEFRLRDLLITGHFLQLIENPIICSHGHLEHM